MFRYILVIATVASLASLALPAAAQQTCNLQLTVSCPSTSSVCTSTTFNAGTNACTGEYLAGFYVTGSAQVSGFSSSLGLSDCFDSSIYPQPGVAYSLCFGSASLAPGGSFTSSATITAGAGQIFGFTSVYDASFNTELASVFAQANVKTATCTPIISSPPVTQSGIDYQVAWTTVSDTTAQYIVEESTSPDFTANLTQVQVNGFSRTFHHDVTNTTTYYYRVHATNCGGTTPPTSAATNTIVIAPPAATSRNPGVTVPIGTTQPVPIRVFIPGSGSTGPAALADPTFVATTDKPYLTVSPSTGTIPPQGMTLTVTASPGSLAAGASTGTLKVTTTTTPSSTSRTSDVTPSGGTTTNVPVTVSIVTPVAPEGKTMPPPNALIIPIVTHVNAAASPFLSDVRLTNASLQATKYQITLTPTNTDGTQSSKVTEVTVGAQQTTALNDIVKNFFGFGATGASDDVGFGSLEIRPLGSSSLETFASSRTYADKAGVGTLGQYIAAIPYSKFATNMQSPVVIPGTGGPSIRKLSLQQVSQSTRFRTNIGLAEGAAQPASGLIHIFDAAGTLLKDVPFSLRAGEQQQYNGFLTNNGIPTLNDGRLEVEITSSTGAVTAYASVLDNVTTDPSAITPVDVSSVSSTRYIVPGIAELPNGTNNFHSDARIFNGGSSDVVATLTFVPFTGFPGASPRTLTIHHGEMAVLDNILPTFFGTTQSTGGSVLITTPSPSSLVATARTYTNVANNGTFGQFIPGVMPSDGVGPGDRPLEVLQLEQSDQFRSNLGLVELTGNPVTVRVSLYQPDSKLTPSLDVFLKANEFQQIGGIIASFLGASTQTYNSRVTVEVVSGSGRVSAYGSVIDNQSLDPTYVPAQH